MKGAAPRADHSKSEAEPRTAEAGTSWYAVMVMMVGGAYAAFFVLRYGGLWTENDTTVFTRAAANTIAFANIIFGQQYAHGFAYPGWVASLSMLTGIGVPVMNTIVLPFVGAMVVVISAYVLYREILGTAVAGFAAVLLLLASPDLLFSALRGNHEKLNITFMLVALWVLIKGFKAMRGDNAVTFSIWVLLFYVITFTNAATNDYFASTLVLACTIALIASAWLARSDTSGEVNRRVILRLALSVAVSWLLILWVMFFVFSPAGHDFGLLRSTLGKLAALFLSLKASSNPYGTASQQWVSPLVASVLAIFRYVLFAGSFGFWAVETWRVTRRRLTVSLEEILLLSLYAAMGLIIAFNVLSDLTNLSFGTNLELRTFTYFTLLAAPMLVSGVRRYGGQPAEQAMATHRSGARATLHALLTTSWGRGLLVGFTTLCVLVGLPKATLDPTVSNLWLFYTPAEIQAVHFFEGHYDARSHTFLWTGVDSRISNAVATTDPLETPRALVHGPTDLPPTRLDWLISPTVVANAEVQGESMPSLAGEDRIYDAGGSQIFHFRPRSPFQS